MRGAADTVPATGRNCQIRFGPGRLWAYEPLSDGEPGAGRLRPAPDSDTLASPETATPAYGQFPKYPGRTATTVAAAKTAETMRKRIFMGRSLQLVADVVRPGPGV